MPNYSLKRLIICPFWIASCQEYLELQRFVSITNEVLSCIASLAMSGNCAVSGQNRGAHYWGGILTHTGIGSCIWDYVNWPLLR